MGVWIETHRSLVALKIDRVTPHVGVWIETPSRLRQMWADCRHSPRGSVD